MSGNNQSSNNTDENPVTRWYNDWCEKTPAITRFLMQLYVGLAIFGFIFYDFVEKYFTLVPGRILYYYQYWRVLTSPFCVMGILDGLLTVYLLYIFGKSMEQMYGSTYLVVMLLYFYLLLTVAYLMIMTIITSIWDSKIYYENGASGPMPVIIMLFVIQSCKDPETPRQLCCFPVQIKSKYIPLVITLPFLLFLALNVPSGFYFLTAVSLDSAGWFKFIEISPSFLSSIENHPSYQFIYNLPYYIPMDSINNMDYDDLHDNQSNKFYYRSKYRYNSSSNYVTNDGGTYNSNHSGNRSGSNNNNSNSLFSGPGYTLVDLPPVSESRSTAQAIADREAAKRAAIERYKKIAAAEENKSNSNNDNDSLV